VAGSEPDCTSTFLQNLSRAKTNRNSAC
jgi:hypothetical protein